MQKLNFKDVLQAVLGRSEKGQDAFIQHAFAAIGTTNQYYAEFGARDGISDSNTFYLRETLGWHGLLLDCGHENKALNLHRRKLTEDNIVAIFDEFKVPEAFDFLSVDVDGNDFWLLRKLLTKYKPRVIMVETNVRFSPETDLVQRYAADWFWQGAGWYGASPRAMAKMARNFGYAAMHIHLDDMILIRTDDLARHACDVPAWESVYAAPRIPLYSSHRDNVFNPEMWVTPDGLCAVNPL